MTTPYSQANRNQVLFMMMKGSAFLILMSYTAEAFATFLRKPMRKTKTVGSGSPAANVEVGGIRNTQTLRARTRSTLRTWTGAVQILELHALRNLKTTSTGKDPFE